MPATPKLLAWIDPRTQGSLAAFVGAGATGSKPATRVCQSAHEAREWVEAQAAELNAVVEWLPAPRRPASPISLAGAPPRGLPEGKAPLPCEVMCDYVILMKAIYCA
jgi:hypothetical protein